ncbi:lysophospholipid acyltransferase family protein [Pedobacter metabolipauper]|uniref:1-acyl-sn-glycerol-3-phosphate acyltransferase n=1 Tax=Pedobacter metabolipauper TaxID=425513 RepID=A0A4R6T0L2_9SPHI|nr:lysophospholipid acyltransferase family protein [Pedobacter metabolipauper]TDQ11118.1 1-acyl-sn-glycerol-3-phosphate acyltransferase [Pedobacter metabolipauper]
MNKLFRKLHRIYALFVILVLSALFYPFYYLASRKPSRYSLLNQLRKLHSILCSSLIGVFFDLNYEVPLEPGKTYIYCANHTSNLDIMVLCIIAKGRFHFMGKDELLNNPVLKLFFKTIDVPVNRDSKISAFRAFKKVGENLENGMSLIIFPEGGIDDAQYPPHMIPFKNGPFRLAIEKKIPIVAISLADVWKKMWDDGSVHGTSPGICKIYIHKPIDTENLVTDDSDLLKDRIFDLINSKLAYK